MSSTARQMIIRRHISYIVVNVLCQLYTMISKVSNYINPQKTETNWAYNILIFLYFGQGIWLNLVRLAEPSLLPVMVYNTKKIFTTKGKVQH